MKIVAVLLLLAVAGQHVNADGDVVADLVARAVGDRLKAILEQFKEVMKTGNATLGLPKLDPLELEHHKLEIEHEKATVKGHVSDLILEGLADYEVQHVDFKISKWNVSIDMLWNNVKGSANYDIDGRLLNKMPVYGAGDAKFDAKNFRFATHAKLKVNYKEKKVSIVSFSNTIISLESLKVDLTGLYNNDELAEFFSAVISDIVPQGLQDFQEEVTTVVNKVLLEQANALLDQYTLDDIMGLIN